MGTIKTIKTEETKTLSQIAGCNSCIYRMHGKEGGCYKFGFTRTELDLGKTLYLSNGGLLDIRHAGRCIVKKTRPIPKPGSHLTWKIVLPEWLHSYKSQHVLEPLATIDYIKKISRELTSAGIAHYEKAVPNGMVLVVSNYAIERGWFNQTRLMG